MRATDTETVRWRLEAGPGVGDTLPTATAIAVAGAFVLLLLPAHGRSHTEIAAAVAVGLALVGLARWLPRNASRALLVCVGYVLFVALLRDAAAASISGFAALFLLPVLWLAWTAGRRELLVALATVTGALAIPLAVAGSSYPAHSGRASAILVVIAAAVGGTIQILRSRASGEARLLSEQNEGLRELDRMKDEFIAVISHELRTPLTSIAGYLELVLDDADLLTPDHHEFLTVVSRNVDRLTLLANDLLLLAAAENGTLALAKTEFELSALLEEAENAARPQATADDIALRLEVDGKSYVHADRPRLAQLLDNLISNAIKFTPTGGSVTVRARRAGDDLLVEVEDSGIGIPADELPRLFDRFYRARTARARKVGGTGLGLAIAKTIADAHDARLDVQSDLGRGTTFQLRLPTTSRTADAVPVQSSVELTIAGGLSLPSRS
ncbi:MAG TPA: ATP-binding protein [Gaiellaceae bacterium]|nr:ATP-binding protein [Gaiellaceae bacterium]